MCRLFGQISIQTASVQDGLATAPYSLLRLSNVKPSRLQKDGWGVVYYSTRKQPRLIKSPKALFDESARFKRLAKNIRSKIVIAHIRAASNPRGLAERSLISKVNSQPYSARNMSFAHNGTLEIPDEVQRHLGPLSRHVQGLNDSEVYFWQFMKFYDRYGDIPQALRACVKETWQLWKKYRARYSHKKKPYTGLNTLVSDGTTLHAMCHYPTAYSGGLCNPRQPWGRMCFSRRDGRVLIASENMDLGPWERLNEGEILSVGPDLSIHRVPLSVTGKMKKGRQA